MAQVRPAPGTHHFGTGHTETGVSLGGDIRVRDWRKEAGPASAGLELCVRAEKWQATSSTVIDAMFMIIPVLPGEGAFSALCRNT